MIVGVLVLVTGMFGWKIYEYVFTPNVRRLSPSSLYILIPTGSGINDVVNILN